MTNLFGLTHLPRQIAAQSGGPTITYRQAYNAAIDAQIPTTYIRGRHYVQPSDVPAIAAHFGIVLLAGGEVHAAA